MQLWNGTDTSLREIQVRMGGEDILFSRLTLIYERLWGAVTTAAPDRIYWSGTFAPDDWELNYVVTEEGGGFIDAATFDGSRIRAVVAAFDDVLIVKDRSMHRLSGTYPGDFSLTQVYGTEGTLAARTLITTAGRLYFLGRDGLCVYDGMTVSSLLHKGDARMQALFGRINQAAVDSACAVLAGDVIRLAVPLDGAAENTHIIEYSLADDSWSLIACPGVRDLLLRREGQKETLLCLTGNGLFEYGAGESAMGTAVWKSPFLAEDLRRRRTGRVSFAVEAPESGALSLCLISENGECRERIPFGAGLTRVRRRMRVRGRSLRFELRSDSLFSLPNGLSIEIETEKDP